MIPRFVELVMRPKSADEDTRRREFILYILLIGTISIVVLAMILLGLSIVVLHNTYVIPRLVVLFCLFLLFVTLLMIARRGYISVAAFMLVVAYYCVGMYLILQWSFDIPGAFLMLSLTLIMAGVLLGTRGGFVVMIFIALGLLLLAHLEGVGATHPDTSWQNIPVSTYDALGAVFIFSVMTVVSWLSNREIKHSLQRAQRSEKELKKQRDDLEVTVEERTRELRQAQLERVSHLYRLAELGKLTSGLFHDLVNPLTTVSLNLQHLSETQRSNSAERALKGIRQIEGFVRSAQKQIKYQDESRTFLVYEEIRDVIEIMHHKAKERGVHIILEGDKTIHAFGNPIKFTQVMMNLIANAIDASGITPNRFRSDILIHVRRESQNITITIQDFGIGILPEHVEKIFEPFFTTKDVEHGTGIGLTISQNIINTDFGGALTVESTLGEGSIFTVRIPEHR